MGSQRKRSRDEYEGANRMTVGDTVARLNGTSKSPDADADREKQDGHKPNDGAGDWQRAESKQSRKKRKKEENNYPAIWHSSHARLQSFVKISDLQNLVLYLLADGNGPQWISVKHHHNFLKVVVLMVPGLEAGMFDGSVPLSKPETEESKHQSNGNTADSSAIDDNATKLPSNSSLSSHTQLEPQSKSRKLHISPDDYYPVRLVRDRLPPELQPLSDIFEHIWPIKTPGDDKYAKMHSPLASMLTSSIVKSQDDRRQEKNKKGPKQPAEAKGWKNQRTPVIDLLASAEELADEGYVLQPAAGESEREGWVRSHDGSLPPNAAAQKEVYSELLQGNNVYAMDCEMCITSPSGTTPPIFSLTRCSLIDWEDKVVMDELVKPAEPITDYLTPYSGITAKMLEPVTTTLADIQAKLLDLIDKDTILIGHSLNSDLNALHLLHQNIIDTALLFPHPRGPPLKSSLKWLAQKYLQREIQAGHGKTGHDSIEDARACLDLVKQKCEKGKLWGTSEASGESIFKRLGRSARPQKQKYNRMGEDEYRTGAVVDWGDPTKGFGGQARVALGCESDEQVVASVKRVLEGDEDDTGVPRGGVDFVWARFRELEAHRGWWSKSKQLNGQVLLDSMTATKSTTPAPLADVVAQTVSHINRIYSALPPCTALIVYSGSGDPRPLAEMQNLQRRFKEEYKSKKWDELSVRWTDEEEQRLRRACEGARRGVGFIGVK